jgi:hypothetical protein
MTYPSVYGDQSPKLKWIGVNIAVYHLAKDK